LIAVNNTTSGQGVSVTIENGEFVYDSVTSFNPGFYYWVTTEDLMFTPPFYNGSSLETFGEWFRWLFSY
jgi:hypothetical protein